MKFLYWVFSLLLCTAIISCKKDKTDNSVDGKFQGTWIERSGKKITIVVSKNPDGNENAPNFFLNLDNNVGYPFVYKLNDAGDVIFLSNKTSTDPSDQNVPYNITFSQKSFTIERFHSSLPNTPEITFDKIH